VSSVENNLPNSDESEEIVVEKPKTIRRKKELNKKLEKLCGDHTKQPKCSSSFIKRILCVFVPDFQAYLLRNRIKALLFFVVHFGLIFIGIILKILCYVKIIASNILNCKGYSGLSIILLVIVLAFLFYFVNSNGLACVLWNSISSLLFAKDDAYFKILSNRGKDLFKPENIL
jgi:hypothetical protein